MSTLPLLLILFGETLPLPFSCVFCSQGIPNHSFSLILENIDYDLTDGILRKADMPIVDTILCQEFLDVNARSDEMHSGFICAGGKGDEESCYVSTLSPCITQFSIARFPLTRFSLMYA